MSFTISSGELITWIIIGLLAGTAAGAILTHNRRGFGWIRNLLLGLVGAFVGGILFNLLNIRIAPDIAVSMDDIISAIVGAALVVLVMRFSRNIRTRK